MFRSQKHLSEAHRCVRQIDPAFSNLLYCRYELAPDFFTLNSTHELICLTNLPAASAERDEQLETCHLHFSSKCLTL